jgi:hypothetical protein
MKYILLLLILISLNTSGQGRKVAVFDPASNSYVWIFVFDTNNPPTSITNPTLTNPVLAGTVTLPAAAVPNAALAGSIAANKLVGSDITLAESQITNLVTDLAARQGFTLSATAATTGAMTTTVAATTSGFTITPTGACTFNASGGTAGQRITFVITTSGVSSFTLTWGTNYRTTATLATGTTTAKIFCVSFIYNGSLWLETGRTAAM